MGKLNKNLVARVLFKRLNVKLNVETDTRPDGSKCLVIGGLTPSWIILNSDTAGKFDLVKVKWQNMTFQEQKPVTGISFLLCLHYIIAEHVNQEYADVVAGVKSGEIKPKKVNMFKFPKRGKKL